MKFTKPKTEKKPYVNCRHTHTHTSSERDRGRGRQWQPELRPCPLAPFFGIHTMTCQVQNAKTHTHTYTMKERTVSWQRIKWQTAECRAQSGGRFAAPSSFPFAAPTTSALCWNNHKIKISYWICWTGRQSISTFAYTVSTLSAPTPLPFSSAAGTSFVS